MHVIGCQFTNQVSASNETKWDRLLVWPWFTLTLSRALERRERVFSVVSIKEINGCAFPYRLFWRCLLNQLLSIAVSNNFQTILYFWWYYICPFFDAYPYFWVWFSSLWHLRLLWPLYWLIFGSRVDMDWPGMDSRRKLVTYTADYFTVFDKLIGLWGRSLSHFQVTFFITLTNVRFILCFDFLYCVHLLVLFTIYL